MFQVLVDSASKGARPEVPYTPTGWELLHADNPAGTRAATKLAQAARRVVRAIEACPVRELVSLREMIREYCWRLY